MQELRLSPGKNTPEIIMSPAGSIQISGRSIHENVAEFFAPVENWISSYVEEPAEITRVDINLEYFNSASAKVFIHLLEILKRVTLKNGRCIYNWYYEEGDEDILERGEYFSIVLKVPFNFIKMSESS
jgi:hypothetical protein